jgi:hypothetical protein
MDKPSPRDEWDLGLPSTKEGEVIAEYGTVGNVGFLNQSQVSMQRADGTTVFCKCGKPATAALIGRNAYIARCSECGLE